MSDTTQTYHLAHKASPSPVTDLKTMDRATAYKILGAAIAVDVLQALLGLSWFGSALTPVIGFVASLGFAQALNRYNIELRRGGYLGRYISASIAELIPFVDDLPFWTLTIASILRSEKVI